MNEFKGTNSDWKEAGHNDNGIFISGDSSQDAIAFVYYNNNTVKIGEGKANARLMINAKRLMECLITAIDLLETNRPQAKQCVTTANQILSDINNED